MFYEKFGRDTYVIRLVRGEKMMKVLEMFCRQERIDGAFFYGIGAVDKVELAHYDVGTQQYSSKKFDQALEVANLTGNISFHQGEMIIHAHGTFSDTAMQCLGGHVVNMRVSATLELHLQKVHALSKLADSETGLKLLDLPYKL